MPRAFLCCSLLLIVLASHAPSHASPAKQAKPESGSIALSNTAISATWSIRDGSLRWRSLTNRFTGATLSLDGSVFELVPKEGPVLRSSDCKIVAEPVLRDVPPSPAASKAAERLPARELRIVLEDPAANIRIVWKAILREGANYVQTLNRKSTQEAKLHDMRRELVRAEESASKLQAVQQQIEEFERRVKEIRDKIASNNSNLTYSV